MIEPRETELKLECEPSDLAVLRSHPLLKNAVRQDEVDLTSTYFDTDDRCFRKAGFALRVRRSGGRYVQTLKSEGDGLLERPEWEWEVAGAEPDRNALADTPFAKILARGGALQPLFTTTVTRRTYLVEQNGSRVEVALDSGRIEAPAAGGRTMSICEVELELKEGAVDAVFAPARAVSNLVPVRLGVRSKAERGYALAANERDRVRKAEPVPLRKGMTAGEAFQAIAYACLRHMRLNEDILLRHRDVDALHQMRIAIRRLRSAFSLFKHLADDVEGARIRVELKRMTEPLGRARNLDVFLKDTLPAERERHPDGTGLPSLETQLADRRAKAYAAVEALLRSDAWRTLLLDLVGWVNSGPWLRNTDCERMTSRDGSAHRFAARELDRRRRQVKKRGRKLKGLTPAERHRVRIAAKKLRYGTEFFAGLYTGKKNGQAPRDPRRSALGFAGPARGVERHRDRR